MSPCDGCKYCVAPWNPAMKIPGCTRRDWDNPAIKGDCYEQKDEVIAVRFCGDHHFLFITKAMVRPWGRVLLLMLPWDEDGDLYYFQIPYRKAGRKMTDCIGLIDDGKPSDVVKALKEGR